MYVSPISTIPQEVLRILFKKFPPEELFTICQVCKLWNQVGSNVWYSYSIRELLPTVSHIDSAVWEEYVNLDKHRLDPTDSGRPVLLKQTYLQVKRLLEKRSFLKRFFSFVDPYPSIEDEVGVTFVTIPKGLTLRKLNDLASHPSKNTRSIRIKIMDAWMSHLGDCPVENTYHVLITNNITKGSRNTSKEDQNKKLKKMGAVLPGLMDVATLVIMAYHSSSRESPVCLYGAHTWTRTRDIVYEDRDIVWTFGHFHDGGPNVGNDAGASGAHDAWYKGAGGVWVLPVLDGGVLVQPELKG